MTTVAKTQHATSFADRGPIARAYRRYLGRASLFMFAMILVSAFLLPLLYMITTAFQQPGQASTPGAPVYPAAPQTGTYQGEQYPIYEVPIDGVTRDLMLVTKGREQSTFVDPADPTATPIVWDGHWRTLTQAWTFAPEFANFTTAWSQLNFPLLLFNTAAIAVLSTIGAVTSGVVVAYGFARFRFPFKNILFIVLIATIILPIQVTLLPLYVIFTKIGWNGTWLPLIVPAFFANAYNVFLLRQYFMSLPRDLDEAAMIDGASPFRVLRSIIVPLSIPAIVAVSLFHFFFAWNDFFLPLLYLGSKPALQPLSVGIQQYNALYSTQPTLIQATALMTMAVPVVVFFLAQRAFMRGVVVTGVDRVGIVRYGYFDDDRREYVITRPDTPLPWINYLGSEDYFGLISNTAGGYSFYRDARLRRLIRYRYNNAPLDVGGRFLYIRDDEDGDYWNPGWQPTQRELDSYACRHGLGYTVIEAARRGIRTETLYIVPPGETLEVWRTRVTNDRPGVARLSLFGAVEFCLWDAQDDATNFQRNLSTGEVRVEDGVVYHVTEYRERRDHFAWFACSVPVQGFDTSREAFVGPYRGWDRPLAVERGATTRSIAHGWQPIGALQATLVLHPGETGEVTFVLGYTENPADDKFDPADSDRPNTARARAAMGRYRGTGQADTDLATVQAAWTERLANLQVTTGDPHVDRMVDTWNPYQCMVTFNLSRSASMFESGIGRGMGFRDSNQDLLGLVHVIPERARARILDIAATQLPDGGAYHQYQPLTKRGNHDVGSGFNDDPAWLVLAVAAYVKETGDLAILDAAVPWDNAEGSETPLHDHLRRCIDFTLDRLGPHGLPLIGRADWNDCLNLNVFSDQPGQSFQTAPNLPGGVAESVFIAGLFVLAAGEEAALASMRGDEAEATRCRSAAAAMTASIEAHAWDGAWYRRAYDRDGRPVGSASNDEGQIFVEPQGMMAMAGVGLEDGRAQTALASVRERLATPHGIVLLQPAYSTYHIELGEISSYPPGYKENGGVFCHTNPWLMIAEAIVGNGDGALDYYLRINPSAREGISDVHRCEPYVYAQMIAGRDAPTHGEAKNSWLTGTAAWNMVAISQWILGIRPEHDGLRVEPAIPDSWPGYRATRRFRGTTYDIEVARCATDGPGTGPGVGVGAAGRRPAIDVTVDGEPIAGTRIPLPAPGTPRVRVEVRLG